MKKTLIISIILSLFSFGLVFFLLQNYLLIRHLQKDLISYFDQSISGEITDQQLPKKIISNLEKINKRLNKINLKSLKPYQQLSSDFLMIAQKLLSHDQKYLVILQNSDELRATGGFMGSYLVLETRSGLLKSPKIQDIYEPDGQFQGFIEAPTGLHEYLSAGKGWRLPDANWWPHFPSSAEQTLFFIEQVKAEKYDGLIALNLQLIEDLLRLTGEIYLPDYQQSVNHENFAALARADRNEFFPGSQEKINFLNHFLTVFKIKMQETIVKNPQGFLQLLATAAQQKDLQIYSRDQELMTLVKKYQLSGQMQKIERGLAYFLVESNVGINKANRLVNRQVKINIEENQETIDINWQNKNSVPYVNYQRIYTNPNTHIISIIVNGETIDQIDQRVVTIDQQNWLEIGFLAPILSQSQASATIKLNSQLPLEDKKKLTLYKQAGLRSVDYQVIFAKQSKTIQLLSDLSLDLD